MSMITQPFKFGSNGDIYVETNTTKIKSAGISQVLMTQGKVANRMGELFWSALGSDIESLKHKSLNEEGFKLEVKVVLVDALRKWFPDLRWNFSIQTIIKNGDKYGDITIEWVEISGIKGSASLQVLI